MRKAPTDEEMVRAISVAFNKTCRDVDYWNNKIAGTARCPWHPEDLEPKIEFSHKSWAISAIWELIHRGFEINGDVMLEVINQTGCDRINAD